MSYLLGFPTPVIEVIAIILGFFLIFAFYFGLRFQPVEVESRNENIESRNEKNESNIEVGR